MSEKIVVKNLYQVFGPNPQRAFKLIERGYSKDEIFEKTGLNVGVQDANFSINAGEIFVVMGLSGSGKSTLVRLLNRLIEPTSGEVLVDGANVVRMSKKDMHQWFPDSIVDGGDVQSSLFEFIGDEENE